MSDDFVENLITDVEVILTQYNDLIDYIGDCIAGIDLGDEFDEMVLIRQNRILYDCVDLISMIDNVEEITE